MILFLPVLLLFLWQCCIQAEHAQIIFLRTAHADREHSAYPETLTFINLPDADAMPASRTAKRSSSLRNSSRSSDRHFHLSPIFKDGVPPAGLRNLLAEIRHTRKRNPFDGKRDHRYYQRLLLYSNPLRAGPC